MTIIRSSNYLAQYPIRFLDSDLLPSGLTVLSLVMFITAEDDEHEKAIFRRADHHLPKEAEAGLFLGRATLSISPSLNWKIRSYR